MLERKHMEDKQKMEIREGNIVCFPFEFQALQLPAEHMRFESFFLEELSVSLCHSNSISTLNHPV